MPEREFEIYLSALTRLLQLTPEQKASISDELRDHLEERLEELVKSGKTHEEAIQLALDEFGDKAGLAVNLTKASRRRFREFAVRSSLALAMLAALTAFFLGNPNPNPGLLQNDVAVAQDVKKPDAKKAGLTLQNDKRERIHLEHNMPVPPKALNDASHCSFNDTPMSDVVQFLAELHNVPILLDKQSLEDAGIPTDEPITLKVAEKPKDGGDGVPLHQLLDWLCEDRGMTWKVQDGIIKLTTREEDEGQLQTVSYNVKPLLSMGYKTSEIRDVLIECLGVMWELNEGAGGRMSMVGDVLTIRQTYQGQLLCLAMMETLLNPEKQAFVRYSKIHPQILKAMDQIVRNVEFVDTPLEDAIEYLAEAAGVRIAIDHMALDESGIPTDEPVNLVMQNKSLKVMFDLMASSLEVRLVVKNGQLTVTSSEEAEETLHAVVYNVSDFSNDNLNALVGSILGTTSGPWQSVDGAGGTAVLIKKQLVVSHTDAIHQQIWNLLHFHRQANKKNRNIQASQPAKDPNAKVKRYYTLPSTSADDLTKVLPESVATSTWAGKNAGRIWKVALGNGPSGGLHSESVLIIEQTEHVHKEITDFLATLRLPSKGLTAEEVPQHFRGHGTGGLNNGSGFGGSGQF